MVKYYWYINMDPEKYSGYGDVKSHIKRISGIPPLKYSYVVESIDGSSHVITGKSGIKILSANDGGNLSDLINIQSSVVSVLINQFNADVEAAANNKNERIKQQRIKSSDFIFPSNDDDNDIMITSLRRRRRIISRMNAKKPCKKPKRSVRKK